VTAEPYIHTFHGRRIYVRDPDLNDTLHLEDIAHGLARVSRFTGQTSHRYSVASHSLMVADLLPSTLHASGLLHDAVEAILGDVSSPLKSLLPGYKDLQARWETAMAVRWGVPLAGPEIKRADWLAYTIERRDLMPHVSDPCPMRDGIEIPPNAPHCTRYVDHPERVAAWWYSEVLLCGVPEIA
jgi:uncharacterized protein